MTRENRNKRFNKIKNVPTERTNKNEKLLALRAIFYSKIQSTQSPLWGRFNKKIIYCINIYLITIITALTFFKLQNKSPVLFTKLKVS